MTSGPRERALSRLPGALGRARGALLRVWATFVVAYTALGSLALVVGPRLLDRPWAVLIGGVGLAGASLCGVGYGLAAIAPDLAGTGTAEARRHCRGAAARLIARIAAWTGGLGLGLAALGAASAQAVEPGPARGAVFVLVGLAVGLVFVVVTGLVVLRSGWAVVVAAVDGIEARAALQAAPSARRGRLASGAVAALTATGFAVAASVAIAAATAGPSLVSLSPERIAEAWRGLVLRQVALQCAAALICLGAGAYVVVAWAELYREPPRPAA